MKKNQKMTQIIALGLLGLALTGCSARTITKAANPFLDPMPVEAATATKTGLDPRASEQWNMDKVGMKSLWANPTQGSRRVVVALLGTGVDYTHEDLAQNILVNRAEWRKLTTGAQNPIDDKDDDGNGYKDDFIGYDFVENDGLPFDRNGSGTAVAGIIGAGANNGIGIRGIAPEVSLLPVRFIDGSGSFFLPRLVQALEYALVQRVDVIVLHTPSYVFGAQSDLFADPEETAKIEKESFKQIMEKIQKARIPVIASAGNTGAQVDGSNMLLNSMKGFDNVVVVTSVDQVDKRPFIANFSMRDVHTSAPGAKVLSTQPGNRYEFVSGTAVSAAHVAGAMALAISAHYGKHSTPALLRSFLDPKASDVVQSLQYETMGGNRLNVQKFLDHVSQL